MSKFRQIGFILVILFFISWPFSLSGKAVSSPSLILETPGDSSRVTSPIYISAQLQHLNGRLMRVILVDRSKNTIARQLLRLETDEVLSIDFSTNLAFEIPRDSSEGLISLAILDSYNRPVALRSAVIMLLSVGEDQITTKNQMSEWLTISQPQPGEIIGGGEVRVTGTIRPLVARPVFFELVNESGGQIGTRQLPVDSAGETFDFDITIPYAFITKTQEVRLTIRQRDSYYGQDIILNSMLISLTP